MDSVSCMINILLFYSSLFWISMLIWLLWLPNIWNKYFTCNENNIQSFTTLSVIPSKAVLPSSNFGHITNYILGKLTECVSKRKQQKMICFNTIQLKSVAWTKNNFGRNTALYSQPQIFKYKIWCIYAVSRGVHFYLVY